VGRGNVRVARQCGKRDAGAARAVWQRHRSCEKQRGTNTEVARGNMAGEMLELLASTAWQRY
jgi:hypothetical protein